MDESEGASKLYGKIAKRYVEAFPEPSDHIDDFLKEVAKDGKVLDVGCGPGIDAGYMASKGYNVIGIDLSKEMIGLAKERFPRIEFRISDMRRLTFGSGSFDGVFVAYSLIHIPKNDVLGVIKSLHGFLKPNGVIYFAFHEGKSQEMFITEPLKPDEKMFLNVFSSDEIKRLIKEAGFSIIKEYQREPIKKEEFDFVKMFILARKQ